MRLDETSGACRSSEWQRGPWTTTEDVSTTSGTTTRGSGASCCEQLVVEEIKDNGGRSTPASATANRYKHAGGGTCTRQNTSFHDPSMIQSVHTRHPFLEPRSSRLMFYLLATGESYCSQICLVSMGFSRDEPPTRGNVKLRGRTRITDRSKEDFEGPGV